MAGAGSSGGPPSGPSTGRCGSAGSMVAGSSTASKAPLRICPSVAAAALSTEASSRWPSRQSSAMQTCRLCSSVSRSSGCGALVARSTVCSTRSCVAGSPCAWMLITRRMLATSSSQTASRCSRYWMPPNAMPTSFAGASAWLQSRRYGRTTSSACSTLGAGEPLPSSSRTARA